MARECFVKNGKLDSGIVKATQAIGHAQGVTKILRENLVQGQEVGEEGEEKYKLRFTVHTQRLDNDTTGQLKGITKTFKEIKDAQL
ncbi:Mitochondrial zinc maintenance protein 1, mitochondrial [Elasticomyces elasticus]|nr:Mitochondrial zinc maintenance protein 1, mitochondrial [Elasticomyces elasticus]KAK3619951.1 Mitochondrial zinc maintenance protein 1, mitochondrial [Elasticomyces elasticus]KAK5740196.1 Mitochondrial zinc maintenance protein 1, mitochondrial [Elasticomyces elasticus]